MIRGVADTNVLVSAILAPAGPPAQILDLVLSRRITLIVNSLVLAEYEEVLKRREFGFGEKTVRDLLAFLELYAERAAPAPSGRQLPDPDDECFLSCALGGGAEFLVTGNKKHFPPVLCRPVKPVLPAEFLEAVKDKI